jgi:peptidoglycan/LPS O-acetylase OafA/YrhL
LAISLILASYNGFQQAASFISEASIQDQYISATIIGSFYLLFYCLMTGKIQIQHNKIYFTLGALTYPLYLIHNAAGKAVIDYYKGDFPEWLLIIITISLALALSYLIHTYIEKKSAPTLKRFLSPKQKNA